MKIRIAVCLNSKGEYVAIGESGPCGAPTAEAWVMEGAVEGIDMSAGEPHRTFWVEVDAEPPPRPAIGAVVVSSSEHAY